MPDVPASSAIILDIIFSLPKWFQIRWGIQNIWETISIIEQNTLGLNYLNELKESNSELIKKEFR